MYFINKFKMLTTALFPKPLRAGLTRSLKDRLLHPRVIPVTLCCRAVQAGVTRAQVLNLWQRVSTVWFPQCVQNLSGLRCIVNISLRCSIFSFTSRYSSDRCVEESWFNAILRHVRGQSFAGLFRSTLGRSVCCTK